ncbi:prenyltransferase/squalene oxidase repeat-containing protein [Chloroflexota bacterium]
MNRKIRSRLIGVLLIFPLLLVPLLAQPVMTAGYPLTASDTEVADALDYLRAEQDTDGSICGFVTSAWVIMAITAAGEDPDDWQIADNPSVVDYLAANGSDAGSASDYARMLLAITAADKDPTDFGGIDFVSLMESTYDDATQQIGDENALNDDVFAILGLIAAGQSADSGIVADSVAFLSSHQNADGSWGWTVGADGDVDMTAAAIMALIAAGESSGSAMISDAIDYISSTLQDNGGFLSWGSTNSETDAWAIGAIVAAGEDPTDASWTSENDNTPVDHLLSLQQAGGQFVFQDGSAGAWPAQTTAKAVIALLAEPYPVAVLEPLPEDPEEGVTIDVRVEGQSHTIWSGSVTVTESTITATNSGDTYHYDDPTALGALDEAAQEGGFDYETTDEWGSLFITSIDGEDGTSPNAWLYAVDYVGPSVGAADFILDETSPPSAPHDEVLFYYISDNNWGALPLRITVDDTEPDVDETFTVTVSQYDNGWSPCEGATVHAGQDYTTNQDGTVDITIDTDMTFEVYAEKEDYIRSNRVTVTVGEGSIQPADNDSVGLTAEILPAISFSIQPDTIDFGELGPGDTSRSKTISMDNDGTWDLTITATVQDTAQGLYVDGINLDDVKCGEFSMSLLRDGSASCGATLTVPTTYSLTGKQNGTVIFWATGAP